MTKICTVPRSTLGGEKKGACKKTRIFYACNIIRLHSVQKILKSAQIEPINLVSLLLPFSLPKIQSRREVVGSVTAPGFLRWSLRLVVSDCRSGVRALPFHSIQENKGQTKKQAKYKYVNHVPHFHSSLKSPQGYSYCNIPLLVSAVTFFLILVGLCFLSFSVIAAITTKGHALNFLKVC